MAQPATLFIRCEMDSLELTEDQIVVRNQIMQVLGTTSVDGMCVQICNLFAPIFHLNVVAGFCNDQFHVWCVNQDGQIIDPTKEQFPKVEGGYRYLQLDSFLETVREIGSHYE